MWYNRTKIIGGDEFMKRFLRCMLCALLILTIVVLPAMPAASASSKIKIMKVSGKDVRLRSGPGDYDVIAKLSNGTKVFYSGSNKKGFYKVTTLGGSTGYVYKDYLSLVETVSKSSVYKAKSKAVFYRRATTGSTKITSVSKGGYLIVSKKSGKWAYARTMSGKYGYVQLSKIKKAF